MFGGVGIDEDDPIFGQQIRMMRQMNTMVNSMFSRGPFGGMGLQMPMPGGFHALQSQQNNQMMPFGFPSMPMMSIGDMNNGINNRGTSFSSSQVVTMTQGPDGRPHIYQASSRVKTGPGGVRETQKTVQDSRSGVRKMAIGHHIGERGHVVEREKNYYNGDEEERQDFINLDEEEAEDFNREFMQKSRSMGAMPANMIRGSSAPRLAALPSTAPRRNLLALPAPPQPETSDSNPTGSSTRVSSAQPPVVAQSGVSRRTANRLATPRRGLRTAPPSPLTLPSPSISSYASVHPHPYAAGVRKVHRSKQKTVSSEPSPSNDSNQN